LIADLARMFFRLSGAVSQMAPRLYFINFRGLRSFFAWASFWGFLPSMQQHVKVFQHLIRRHLDRTEELAGVYIAANRGPAFANSLLPDCHTLIVLFQGQQNNYSYSNNRITGFLQKPDHVLYIAPLCPNALDWNYSCQRLGIQILQDRLNMSWNDHKEPGSPARKPDVWYSRNIQPPEDLRYMLSALQARGGFPSDSRLSVRLTALIYEKILEILALPQAQELPPADTGALIKAYLHDNLQQPINCKIIAGIFQLNPDYVSRLFRKDGGFAAYLNRIRICHARDLLQNTRLSTVEISTMCGFMQPSYFIKVFRRECGCTPQNFRHLTPPLHDL
jgi:AraC-like DNA-binding protein